MAEIFKSKLTSSDSKSFCHCHLNCQKNLRSFLRLNYAILSVLSLLIFFVAPPDVRIGTEDNFRYYSPQTSGSFTTMKRKRSAKNQVRNIFLQQSLDFNHHCLFFFLWQSNLTNFFIMIISKGFILTFKWYLFTSTET